MQQTNRQTDRIAVAITHSVLSRVKTKIFIAAFNFFYYTLNHILSIHFYSVDRTHLYSAQVWHVLHLRDITIFKTPQIFWQLIITFFHQSA